MRSRTRGAYVAGFAVIALLLVLVGTCFAEEEPEVDNSKTTQKLKSLKGNGGAKPVVTIYEFRSSVPEVPAKAGQDMFVTALMKSGAFAVAERGRLNEGILREKQLNATGQTTGNSASRKMAGASYIFEVVVSEANAGESQTEGGVSVGGMDVGLGSATDGIGMDVRIVDAESGIVVDAVNVRKKIESTSAIVSGVGKLAQSWFASKLKSTTLAAVNAVNAVNELNPDANVKSSRKEGVDKALRSCIETCVYELAKRLGED
jgi:curli biogenesis system outer membrane secretion channel CsgG